jgi:hypothetical protein
MYINSKYQSEWGRTKKKLSCFKNWISIAYSVGWWLVSRVVVGADLL